jgi:3-deoxy-D-manno-octulosonate 8-phosphate phosphatase (KDO 8-P phosphatase)
VRLLVLDVDGVLTDGRLYFGPDGEQIKAFHVHDGYGIKLLQQAGIDVAVVSGRLSPAVAARCRELKIAHVVQGCDNKVDAVARIAGELELDMKEVACVVDDTSDLALAAAVGLAFAVRDAHPALKRKVKRITRLGGGRGAVREVCDWLVSNARARAKT